MPKINPFDWYVTVQADKAITVVCSKQHDLRVKGVGTCIYHREVLPIPMIEEMCEERERLQCVNVFLAQVSSVSAGLPDYDGIS